MTTTTPSPSAPPTPLRASPQGHIPARLWHLQTTLQNLFLKGVLAPGPQGWASAPSNIALLKYWGKVPGRWQVPFGPSLSMTLGSFRAHTRIQCSAQQGPGGSQAPSQPQFALTLGGQTRPLPKKMEQFLAALTWGWVEPGSSFHMESVNTFPTACGVASSAAGYAALVGALAHLFGLKNHMGPNDFAYWLAQWSRLGSGSAGRSCLETPDPWVVWEPDTADANGTLSYALPGPGLGHVVVVLDGNEKSLPSSVGHVSALESPFQPIRLGGLAASFEAMKTAVAQGAWGALGALAEADALAMHAVMHTGTPPAPYFGKPTAEFIGHFLQWRHKEGLRAFWTMDAGPNPHILFPEEERQAIDGFLKTYPYTTLWNTSHQGLALGEEDAQQ